MNVDADQVSGSGAMSVDEYIAGSPAAVQDQLEQIRRAIRRAAPTASEVISYRIPPRLIARIVRFRIKSVTASPKRKSTAKEK